MSSILLYFAHLYIVNFIIRLGSVSGFEHLKTRCLLVSLLSICMAKLAHHFAYKYVIVNAKRIIRMSDDNGERGSTDSAIYANQVLINQPEGDHCTKTEEMINGDSNLIV